MDNTYNNSKTTTQKTYPSYPIWAHGTGYVLTMDLVKEIAAGVPYALRPDRLFKLEDVSMGSWVEAVATVCLCVVVTVLHVIVHTEHTT